MHMRRQREALIVRRRRAFTLLELVLALAITLVLAAIAIPAYGNYRERARTKSAIKQIHEIELEITEFELEHEMYPPSLAVIEMDGMRDPWGNPFHYLRIDGPNPPKKGDLRKDKNLVPINTDYDLYSPGPDGDSKMPLTAKASRDDIIRANDGGFIGVASDY
jgi:general secretion pathway protein G